MKLYQLKALSLIPDALSLKRNDCEDRVGHIYFFEDIAFSTNGHIVLVIPHKMPALDRPVGIHATVITSFLKDFSKTKFELSSLEIKKKSGDVYTLATEFESLDTKVIAPPQRLAEPVRNNTKLTPLAKEGQLFNWKYMANMEKAVAMAAGIPPKLATGHLTYTFCDKRCVMSAEIAQGTVYGVVLGISQPKRK